MAKPKTQCSIKQTKRKRIELKLEEEKKKLNDKTLVGIDARKRKEKRRSSLIIPAMNKYTAQRSICPKKAVPLKRSKSYEAVESKGRAIQLCEKKRSRSEQSKVHYKDHQSLFSKEEADLCRPSVRSNVPKDQSLCLDSLLLAPDDDGSID